MPVPFELTNNPFNILGVSLRTKKDEIASAHDDALADHRWPETALARAQQALLTPKPRLEAEISWLPTTSPSSAKGLLAKLSDGDFAACHLALQNMAGLDRANLAADLCSRNPGGTGYVSALVDAYSEFDEGSVEKVLSDNRAVSGAGRLDPALVAPALATLRTAHAKAAMENIKAQASPADAMLELSQFLDYEDENVQHLLGDIAKQYDLWSEPDLRAVRDSILAEITTMRSNPSAHAPIARIAGLLDEWDAISRPMQVIEQFKGHDEPRSRELHGDLRELCIWLANKEACYEQALAISKMLLKTFPDLPSVSLDLSKDIERLEGLVAEAKTHQRLKPLADFIENIDGKVKELGWDLVKSGFGPSSRGQAKTLYTAFDQCVATTAGTEDADMPWTLLRHIGIKLNNEMDDSQAALALIEGLNKHAAKPSHEVAAKLAEDRKTIRGNVLFSELGGAMQGGNTDKALSIIEQLIANGSEGEQSKELHALKAKILSRKRAGRIKAFVWLAVIGGGIAILAFNDHSGSRRYTPSTSHAPSKPYTPAPTYTPSNPQSNTSRPTVPAGSETLETKPRVGSDIVLSRSEIRYCLFQNARLDYLKLRVTQSLYDKFNVLIDDWNSRCSSYRYRESDMNAARADAAKHNAEIVQSAQKILNGWTAASAPVAPKPSLPPVRLVPPVRPATNQSTPNSDISSPHGALIVQSKLRNLGFYTGVVDGSWGPASQTALRAWKRSVGLPDNDTWDRAIETRLME